MVRRVHIAVVLLAATLGGCGGYVMSDPESTASFSSASTNHNPAAMAGAADRKEAATLNALFASANQGRSDRTIPGANPAALASAADSTDEPSHPPARETIEPRGRAYLFRGVAGLIYSRGMDSLTERIRQAGIPASVQTYLTWRGAADQAIKDYLRDPAPITLIGHSMGGDAALSFAGALNAENIPVSLLVTYDPTRIADDVPANVERYINIYQSSNFMGGGNVVQGSRFHGHYASFNLKQHSEIIHINIEKAERIQEQIVSKIAQLGSTAASAQGETVPLRLEVPGNVAVELWDSGLPVQAHAGDTLKSLAATYHVPLWALGEINPISARAALAEGQPIIIPRHLAPMTVPSPMTSYAPIAR
jgi:LysM repeat protein